MSAWRATGATGPAPPSGSTEMKGANRLLLGGMAFSSAKFSRQERTEKINFLHFHGPIYEGGSLSGMRSASPVGVGRVVCCLMNRAAGGPLTKFIKRGLEASE